MTREEAIVDIRDNIKPIVGGKSLDIAIKALEEKSILDKIIAEIVEMRSKQNVGVLECLDIIDKYRGEEV